RVAHFFFDAPAPTEIYTLSLHDALPISAAAGGAAALGDVAQGQDLAGVGVGDVGQVDAECDRVVLGEAGGVRRNHGAVAADARRSEEHTSELQSRENLVCRLLLEKKKRH